MRTRITEIPCENDQALSHLDNVLIPNATVPTSGAAVVNQMFVLKYMVPLNPSSFFLLLGAMGSSNA